jgi:hypothetical protein
LILGNDLNRLLDLKSKDIGLSPLSKEVDVFNLIVVGTFLFNVPLDFFRLGEVDWSSFLNLINHLVLCGEGDQLVYVHVAEVGFNVGADHSFALNELKHRLIFLSE